MTFVLVDYGGFQLQKTFFDWVYHFQLQIVIENKLKRQLQMWCFPLIDILIHNLPTIYLSTSLPMHLLTTFLLIYLPTYLQCTTYLPTNYYIINNEHNLAGAYTQMPTKHIKISNIINDLNLANLTCCVSHVAFGMVYIYSFFWLTHHSHLVFCQ